MNRIKLTVSEICLKGVPKDKINTGQISKDIAKHNYALTLEELVERISFGYAFCPCTFKEKRRKKEYILQRQLFAPDFDGPKGTKDSCPLTFDDAMKRAEGYHLPVVIAYETLSSVNYGRYRLLFIYNEPITDIRLMELINRLLLCVFPEADQSTSDLAKMFYPGNNVKFLCENPIYIDTLAVAAETEIRRQNADLWRKRISSIREATNVVTIGSNIKIGFFDELTENVEFIPVETFNNIQQTEKIPQNNSENSLNSIYHSAHTFSYSELKELTEFMSKSGENNISNKLLSIICGIKNNKNYITSLQISLTIEEQSQIMSNLDYFGMKFDTCILGAISANRFYYDKHSDNIYFAEMKRLNPFGNYIMLSATADNFICQRMFGDFCRVEFHECEKVRYKGKVLIYSDETYSRNCIQKNTDIVKNISEKFPDDCFVTFRSEMYAINTLPDRKMYFGKALGTNLFSGKNITIIGTPHKPEFVYHLFAQALDCDCEDNLSTRKTIANGFEFRIMTYSNENLRKIQLYMINTDVEQAVGRARLIHHECVVRVFGAFPAEQGELCDE